jgi:hypothetical protein
MPTLGGAPDCLLWISGESPSVLVPSTSSSDVLWFRYLSGSPGDRHFIFNKLYFANNELFIEGIVSFGVFLRYFLSDALIKPYPSFA